MIHLRGGNAGERVNVVNVIPYCFYLLGESTFEFCQGGGNIQTLAEWLSAMGIEAFIRGP